MSTKRTSPDKPAPSRRRIEFLDFAKGCAMLGIVLYHYFRGFFPGMGDKIVMAGGAGVHLFLILSGFGLALSSKQLPVSVFYHKRFSRVLIPYFLAITLIFLINLAIPIYPDAGLYAYLGNILLFKMFDESIINSFGGHFWFLSTIIQFYLVYPILNRLLRHVPYSRFVEGSLLISMIYWFMLARMGVEGLRIWNSFFLQYLWEFCGGMVLARLYVETNLAFWKQRPSLLLLTGLGGMGLMAVMALKGGDVGRVFNDIPSAIGYTSLVAFCYALLAAMNRAGSGLRRAMTWIGSISYELYLLHMLVFSLFAWFLAGGNSTSLSLTGRLAALPVALLTAVLFSRLLQFLQRKK